jgi:hypothetical protein
MTINNITKNFLIIAYPAARPQAAQTGSFIGKCQSGKMANWLLLNPGRLLGTRDSTGSAAARISRTAFRGENPPQPAGGIAQCGR